MAIENSITFGGVNSADYGIYISGEGVFNAPKRDVEMITIPGRNGEFALDQGRFENITVTYPAFNFEPGDYSAFVQNLSDFRNAICSQKGYQRLTDTFHPDEYRMAVYTEGLEIKPIKYNTASQFSIVFECKPQRFLMSGETAISVTSGETLLNPTLFDSHPMLEVTGYGSVGINGETVTVNNVVLGETQISNAKQNQSLPTSVHLVAGNLNSGDLIYQKDTQGIRVTLTIQATTAVISSGSVAAVTNGVCSYQGISSREVRLVVYPTIPNYTKGTDQTTTTTVSLRLKLNGQTTYNCTYTVTTQYTGSSNSIQVTASRGEGWPPTGTMKYETKCSVSPFYGDSTKTLLPTPMYIDLDIGEAYGEINGEIISFNSIVSMPAKLPALDVGINTIAYDNTVTDLKITPRWWKI